MVRHSFSAELEYSFILGQQTIQNKTEWLTICTTVSVVGGRKRGDANNVELEQTEPAFSTNPTCTNRKYPGGCEVTNGQRHLGGSDCA